MTISSTINTDRAAIYTTLSQLIAFPNREIHDALCAGTLELLDDETGVDVPTPYAAYEAEYIRLFEIAPKRPPCPLYEGYWRGRDQSERRELMAELMRFYRFFGISLGDEVREMPDHLAVELEFMALLTEGEATADARDGDVGSFRRAQRDFLQRHLADWTPKLAARIHELDADPFFQALIAEIDAQVQDDLATFGSEQCD